MLIIESETSVSYYSTISHNIVLKLILLFYAYTPVLGKKPCNILIILLTRLSQRTRRPMIGAQINYWDLIGFS
jgi:hypothetical protein